MRIQEYPLSYTQEVACPSCNGTNRAYVMSGMSDCCPHFYCNLCSNVLLRKSDQDIVRKESATDGLLKKIADSLPACPCGGHFRPGSNPKCKHCRAEFKHQDDVLSRLLDPHMICMEDAYVFGDSDQPDRPYQVKFIKG